MSLATFQAALGRAIRGPDGGGTSQAAPNATVGLTSSPEEYAQFERLRASRGFHFTLAVRRSWCEGRAANTARRTLSVLPAGDRRELLREWIDAGGGASSFVANEAEAFLEFIAGRLPDPSHALTLCRLEQAVYRAGSRAATFQAPPASMLSGPDTTLRAGRYAALVPFFVEPDDLSAALQSALPIPAPAEPNCHLLFAPGIPGLFRRARKEEAQLWAALARPIPARVLWKLKRFRKWIQPLVAVGALDANCAEGDGDTAPDRD